MAIGPGTRLGPYEVTALLGEGGMGKVWRAHHTRLKRDDALKVLPDAFASDPDRLARFQREAQVLASLNHPNIAHVYGLEHSDGVQALVMELVEGRTLADRIAQGPIPVDEALPIAKQIANALEAAHDQGIIHRDLKPANIKVRPDGTVKVLDFGLAKALEPVSGTHIDATASPTITSPAMMTGVGMLLGTAAYMSPEQARGKMVDKRADIWAFGVVFYEMLTGRPLFTGEDVAEIVASVVKETPSLDRLPQGLPPAIKHLIARCLVRDPFKRLRDIGEARLLLEDPTQDSERAPDTFSRSARLAMWIGSGAVASALVALAAGFVQRPTLPDRDLSLSVALPENLSVASLALSPDGRRLAMALTGDGTRRLWLRTLDSPQLQSLPDTVDAQYPFWSPDNGFIGFQSGASLKVIPVTGGPSQVLCEGAGSGGTWNQDGVVLFGGVGPIRRVSATGGPCTDVTRTEPGVFHRFPVFLSDGNHFLYLVDGADVARNGIYVAALDSPANARRLLPDRSSAVFVPRATEDGRDHILFLRDFTLMAQPFDAVTLQLAGEVFAVASDGSFSSSGVLRHVAASVSDNGHLAYLANRTTTALLAWRDRSGREVEAVVRGEQGMVALSPDGKTAAIGSASGLWLRDLTRGTDTRFTSFPLAGTSPVWSPDGARIAFGDSNAIYMKAPSDTGDAVRLLRSEYTVFPSDWSRDGRHLLYTEINPKTRADLRVLPDPLTPSDRREPVTVLATEFNETMGQFSPDGRWMAYVSDESGDSAVYVRPYPSGPGKWRVSRNRAVQPRWRGDGRELYFMAGAASYNWMAVSFRPVSDGSPEIGEPTPLFTFSSLTASFALNRFVYSPSADGQRFLVNSRADSNSGILNVSTNWQKAAINGGAK